MTNGQLPGRIWHIVAAHGYAGVDIFFALSGFLICGKLLSEQRRTNTVDLKQFYIRRSFRILPALFLYLAMLSTLAAVGWVKASRWEFESTLLYVRNYFPAFNGHVLGQYTAHFWSLAVEEHFYLLWPLLMLLLGPKVRRIGFVALALAVAVFIWRSLDIHYGWLIPYGTSVDSKTDTRIDALVWGCLAAIVYPYIHPRVRALSFGRNIWLPIAVVLAAVLVLKSVPGGSLIKAILFPALVMSTAISPSSVLGRILEFRLLKWTGRLSYGIYVWQQLLIFPTLSPHSPLRALQHFPANIAFVFLLAAASYYSIERPMIELGRRLGRQRIFEPPLRGLGHTT
jgi:peptidoglycan/LPS O-acetylase OafA/YrhL